MEDRVAPAVLTVNSLLDNTTAGDGLVTLREAVTAANTQTTDDLGVTGTGNDTIQFDPSLFTAGPQSLDLSLVGDTSAGPSAVLITSQIVIIGPGGTNGLTIERHPSVPNLRLFNVGSTGNLTLDQLTLSGGRAVGTAGSDETAGGVGGDGGVGRGGAVLNQGRLTIQNSTLSGNLAQGGNGGSGGDASVAYSGGNGGAGGNAQGGAIFNAAGTTFTLTSSTLSGNTAQGGNGGNGGNAYINSNLTSGNPGGDGGLGGFAQGGGIFNDAGAIVGLTDSPLTNNTVQGGSGGNALLAVIGTGGSGQGGAIFNATGGSLTLNDSPLSTNTSRGGDGGNNAAGSAGNGQGGAVFNDAGATLTLQNAPLSGNAAQGGAGTSSGNGKGSGDGGNGQGGAIFNAAGLTLTSATLSGNTAKGGPRTGAGSSGQGGAIFSAAGSSLTLSDTTLSGNAAQGGAANASGSGKGGASGGDGGSGQGGAIFSDAGSSLTLTNANLSANTAQGGAGCAATATTDGGVGGSGQGGGIFNAAGTTFSLTTATISGNMAQGGAGGNTGSASSGGMGGCGQGGAIFNAAALTITTATLSGNTAQGGAGGSGTNSGDSGAGGSGRGGVVFSAAGSSLTLTDSALSGNTAQGGTGGLSSGSSANNGDGGSGQGGALFHGFGSSLTVSDSTLTANTAQAGAVGGGKANSNSGASGGSGQGGAIFSETGTSLTLTNATLSGNKTQCSAGGAGGSEFDGGVGGSGQGGAIFNGIGSTLTLAKVTLTGNMSQGGTGGAGGAGKSAAGGRGGVGGNAQGGAIFNAAGSTLTLTDATLSGNTAQGGTGGVGGTGADVAGSGGSGGDGQGGAIFNATGSILILASSTLSGNTAQGNSGGAGGTGLYGNFYGSVLNGAGGNGGSGGDGQGGAIFNYAGGNLTLTDSTLSGNTARGNFGGAGGTGAENGVDGTAGNGQGGGVFNDNGTLSINRGTLAFNAALDSLGNAVLAAGRQVFSVADGATATATITNSILGQNDTDAEEFTGVAVNGGTSIAGGTDNLIRTSSGFSGTNTLTGDPLLGPLANYGGATQTLALLPGSPTIDAGSSVILTTLAAAIPDALATSISVADTASIGVGLYVRIDSEIMLVTGVIDGTTLAVTRGQLGTQVAAHNATGVDVTLAADQRGVANVGAPDLGAFESRGFTIATKSGSGQVTGVSTDFGAPLVATVTANNPLEPVAGGVVIFTPPATGASATPANTSVTIAADGTASTTATANDTAGTYAVTATANGIANSANFSLTNVGATTVSSIVRATPSGPFTNAASVTYTVSFVDPTLGLTASNFDLTGTAGIANSNIGTPTTSNGGSTWSVPITGLAAANGTLTLTLVNGAGLDHAPTNLPFAGETYSIDSTQPTASIDSTPPASTNSTSATFGFSGSDPTFGGVSSDVNHLEISLDGGGFTTATSTQTFDSLFEGSHTFRVRAIDNAGNVSSVASYTWMVDFTLPTASIDSKPPVVTNSTTATFGFSGTDPIHRGVSSGVDHLEISLDGGGFTTATSTQTFDSLSEGSHTFQARAVDSAGNESSIASYTWMVDLTLPTVSIDSTPPTVTNRTTATFGFSGTDPIGGGVSSGVDHLEISLDGSTFITATSSRTFTGLSQGSHTFRVRALDNAGNVSSVTSYTWVVDTTAPTASITSQPSNLASSASATFGFTGSDALSGVDHLELSLDGSPFATATSTQTFNSLSEGSHTFRVRAVDNAGNVSSIASYTWVVDTQPPSVGIIGPSVSTIAPGTTRVVTYQITYSDPNLASISLKAGDITLNKLGTANGTVSVTGTGDTRTVTISNITGLGSLGITLAAGTATDTLSHAALGAGPSTMFQVRPNTKFDMKSSTKAPSAGWNSVQPTTAYSTATGFGWLSTTGLKGITAPVPSPLPPGTDATMYGDAVYGTGSATFRMFVGVGQTATVRVHSYLPFVALPVYFAGASVSVTGGGTGTVRSPLSGGTQPYVDVQGQADANGFLDVTVSVPTGHVFWAINGLEIIPSI